MYGNAAGFNEAAGIPRGRPRNNVISMRLRPGYSGRPRRASMRPRVFPAEDAQHAELAAIGSVASMRPRVFPAEDLLRRTLRGKVPKLQ